MNIKPLGDNVVIKLIEKESVTASGIVLPETADKEKKEEGEVVAVGPGKTLDNGSRAPMDIAVGQKVLFKKWGGDDVTIENVDYKIVSAEDILAIVE